MTIRGSLAQLWQDIVNPVPAAPSITADSPQSGKAGPLGPGAGVLQTEYIMSSALGKRDAERMRKAMKIGMDVDWIRAAERAIRDALVGCDWKLTDPDDEVIDEDYGNQIAVQAYKLLANPQGELPLTGPEGVGRRQSRRQQLTLTSRHMGLAGNAAWYLDTPDGNGLPHAILYIRPDRLEPQCRENGTLIGWLLDKKPGYAGTPLDINMLRLLQYDPPDEGIFGIGLIESAVVKAVNSGLIDSHFRSLLSSGGRMSGIIAPREGAITDDNVYNQLVRDWRNVVEQPEAARRLQIVRAPMDFTSTVQSVNDMSIIDLMTQNRDALLALWGVPLTMLNGQNAGSTGLNGGESRKYDEAVLWQSAVDARVVEIVEAYQSILDLWEPVLGWAPQLSFDAPTFDDDAPAYEQAGKAIGLPLRNSERRRIVGLEPFGDPALDNAIWMPINVQQMSMAPDEETGKIPDMEDVPGQEPKEPPPALAAFAGGAPAGPAAANAQRSGALPPAAGSPAVPAALAAKAAALEVKAGLKVMPISARKLRDQMDSRVVPKVQAAVHAALESQGDAIAKAVEANWASIVKHNGHDESQWWREGKIGEALRPAIAGMAEQVEAHLREALNG